MFDADLVEHPRDVVANRLFRQPERCGDLRIVETLSNTFEYGAFARRQLIERQRAVPCRMIGGHLQERCNLVDRTRPCRFVGKRHMVLTIDLDETGVADQACEQAALLDRHHGVALGMQDQDRAFHLARHLAHICIPANLQQANGDLGGSGRALLVGP